MPKFVGDNGGATYQGVTKDTVTIVIKYIDYGQLRPALSAGGLEMTPVQKQDAIDAFGAFFSKHYELYGRKLKVIVWERPLTTDPAALRTEAKELVAKYKPFAVTSAGPDLLQAAFAEQLALLGVMSEGGDSDLPDDWWRRQAPYAWGAAPSGFKKADMFADYYCKKMSGKNATLAGDPTLRLKKRKLAVISSEDPLDSSTADRTTKQVSGGMCGSAADGVTRYTTPAETTQAQNQLPTLVTRMKNDGITTVLTAGAGVCITSQECDKQGFYPENVLSCPVCDYDVAGQFYVKLGSSTQAQNWFGVGWQAKEAALAESDYSKAGRSVNPQYEAPWLAVREWVEMAFWARMMQWAGPNLTPQTVEKGAHSSPQLNGFVNQNGGPAWKCCDPYAQGWNFGKDSFTAWSDTREIFWSNTAVSPVNNQPGAFVCVNDCKRYPVGGWPAGEPKQQ